MATLLSQAQALIDYANGVTGKSDTTLGDAVKSLADNYGGTSGSVSFPELTDYTLLSSQVKALTAYCNSIDGHSDTKLGDAMRHLADGTPQWMKDAAETYGIPLANLKTAYAEWGNVQYSFVANEDGKYGAIANDSESAIDTLVVPTTSSRWEFAVRFHNTDNGFVGRHDVDNRFFFGIGSDKEEYFYANIGGVNATTIKKDTNRHDVILDAQNKVCYVDGIKSTPTSVKVSSSLSLYLFKLNGGSQTPTDSMWYSRHYENGVLVKYFVPFYDQDTNEYCMLDLVEYKKYFNVKTSGSFTYSFE